MLEEKKSLLLGLLAVVFWSTVATAFKIALRFVSPTQLLVFASISSATILFAIILFQGKLKDLAFLSKKDWLLSLLIGFLNPFLYYLVLFKAYSLLPAQEALSLNYTWAIVLTILSSIFQKKRITFLSYIALIVSFFGVLVIISKGSIVTLKPSNSLGAILALSSSLIWGASWILNILSNVKDLLRMFLNFLFGSVFGLFFLLYSESFSFPNYQSFLPILYIGAFEMGLTFLIWNKALKLSSNPARINNLIYLSPVLSFVFISLILKETIYITSIVGLFLIISGILLKNITLLRNRKNK
ncbi:DMT family transporter [Bacteroidetes/Chlorobi group bacterium Naka2016]|jgi:drug/metabolite transporter (DMT)-like permease|nr:MAG: DMT family transporter [Bacteroidetes/Chlorobi group bacterium Naka2016]